MTASITANGIDIAYRLEGATDRPVLMLSNSLMSDLSMWDDQMAPLLERFRVLRYDTRGHGGTQAPPPPYAIEQLGEDARGLLDALGIDTVHFMGLSMGGFVGQRLATEYPERVQSLVLCDTAAYMPPAEMWNERIATAEASGVEALLAGTLERWFTEPFRNRESEVMLRIATMIRRTPAHGYVGCASAIRDMDQRERLSRVRVPTLVVVGKEDPATPVDRARILHDGIDGSEMVVIEDAAHLPNVEQTATFNRITLDFLDRQIGGA
jgi:3-oxoadipate enol-lactonase